MLDHVCRACGQNIDGLVGRYEKRGDYYLCSTCCALPPEPRTCETCDGKGKLRLSIQTHKGCRAGFTDCDNCNGSGLAPVSLRHVSAEDAEKVRNCIRSLMTQLCAYRWSEKDDDIAAGHGVPKALDVLDSIAGKEEPR